MATQVTNNQHTQLNEVPVDVDDITLLVNTRKFASGRKFASDRKLQGHRKFARSQKVARSQKFCKVTESPQGHRKF